MRRLLLDTHVFLWWLENNSRLGPRAIEIIADQASQVFVSAVSGWEIAIKCASGKLEAPDDLEAAVTAKGFDHLPMAFAHGQCAGALPMHHRDPFDRMLIAQAQCENLELVTVDAKFQCYDALCLIQADT